MICILNLESLVLPNLNTSVPSSQEIGSERLCDLHGRIVKSPEILFSSPPSPLSFSLPGAFLECKAYLHKEKAKAVQSGWFS